MCDVAPVFSHVAAHRYGLQVEQEHTLVPAAVMTPASCRSGQVGVTINGEDIYLLMKNININLKK